MTLVRFQGGHRFRVKGEPAKVVETLEAPELLALSPAGIKDFKPRIVVKVGDKVQIGQEIAHHKKNDVIKLTSPAGGVVEEIRYGRRRVLKGVVIKRDAEESAVDFGACQTDALGKLSASEIETRLLESGLWPQLTSFPGSSMPLLESERGEKLLAGIYVSALFTESHTLETSLVLDNNTENFTAGLLALSRLHPNLKIFFKQGMSVPEQIRSAFKDNICFIEDKYPAENIGVQAFYTKRLKKNEFIVGASAQTVIDIGYLFRKGRVRTERLYAVCGNAAQKPMHFRGRKGMAVSDLTQIFSEQVDGSQIRFISGGLFTGKRVSAEDFLGSLDESVSVLAEDRHRIPFVFFRPGLNRLSLSRAWFSALRTDMEAESSTSNNGEERACIQCRACIDVCPVDLIPNLIMKASVTGEIEAMEALSIHDCVDCGLCTFVCPSKIELGRDILDGKSLIEKEG